MNATGSNNDSSTAGLYHGQEEMIQIEMTKVVGADRKLETVHSSRYVRSGCVATQASIQAKAVDLGVNQRR